MDFCVLGRFKTHDFTAFLRHFALQQLLMYFRVVAFCRTFLRNYNRDFFSLAMINESSGSIISDRWKLHGLLQQEE